MRTIQVTEDELGDILQAMDALHARVGRELHDVPEGNVRLRDEYIRRLAHIRRLRTQIRLAK